MGQNSIVPILMQLAGQLPVLLVYVTGIVLSLAFMGRCRGPSLLALIACVVMLLSSIGYTLVFQMLVRMHSEMGWSSEKFGRAMSMMAIVTSFLHAGCLGLLLGAVFSARKPSARSAG